MNRSGIFVGKSSLKDVELIRRLRRFPQIFNQENRNRGNGISEIEGKAARVAASESGDERVSNQEAELGSRAVVSAVPSGSGPWK